MNVTVSLFDRWKAAKGVQSDRAALKMLGLSPGAAVHWRGGREAAANVVERLALDLGDDPAPHVVAAMANQAQGEAARTLKRLARQLGAAAAVVLAVALPYRAEASAHGVAPEQPHAGCIMRSIG